MINLSFLGDFCPINRVQESLIKNEKHLIYKEFLSEFNDSDLVVINLECPLTDSNNEIEKIGPNLKAQPETINGIKLGKKNIVTLANNHIMDYGVDGLSDTIRICKKNNVLTIGAGNNLNEAIKPIYIKKENKTIAFLNFCEDEFSTTYDDRPGTAPINSLLNYRAIKLAKRNSDILIIIVHGGSEHFSLPNPFIRETFYFFAELGADIIIGHHTHCVSGFEKYKGSLLFYSLGNFLFDNKKSLMSKWNIGVLLKIFISESISYKFIPFIQNDVNVGIHYLSETEQNAFQKNLLHLNKILTNNEAWLNEWSKYIKSRQEDYVSRILAYNNLSKKIIKTFKLYKLQSSKQILFLKNYFHCQSHQVLLKTLFKRK